MLSLLAPQLKQNQIKKKGKDRFEEKKSTKAQPQRCAWMRTSKVLSLAPDVKTTLTSSETGIMQSIIQVISYDISFILYITEESDSTLLKLYHQMFYDICFDE